MAHVVHLTTVHDPGDNRIFHRECVSLCRAGHRVTLIAGGCSTYVAGIHLLGVSLPSARLGRMTWGVLKVLWTALRLRADVYHFHDPELIPAGLVLRLGGSKVVFDVHEDYRTAIMEREYLPRWLRGGISCMFALLEWIAARSFRIVVAERYYSERWPHAIPVLNYAEFPALSDAALANRPVLGPQRLIYTGNVKSYRGAFVHVALLERLPRAELFLVGRCSNELADELRRRAGETLTRLHLEGVGHMVPFTRIVSCYTQEQWTAALALFPPSPHTRRKELTKIFEYMAYAIPVVCSDFPNLRRIVEDAGCGFCVDPDDPEAAAAAIRWLADHPARAREMGRRGRQAVSDRYNWGTQAERLVGLYDELVSTTER